ncbi:N-acetyltransferase family protein [Micromonosporaceae bacterium Da 78-11]
MLEIRPITDADVDAVAEVHVRTWQAGYAGIVPAEHLAALEPAAFAERRRQHRPRAGEHTLVADVDGTVVGFVAFGPYRLAHDEGLDSRMGELYAIYVHPDHWGEGAGRRLIEAAKAGLADAGFPDMRLWVLADNDRARRFYERAGLTPDGAIDYYTPGSTGVRLPEMRYATAL